ncbi:hypothetical protein [Nostoc sp. UHCC 0252]|uniref:hypothetical protein n=1 Tax=Nostoc sp. UHCC 0252 TaxID=3110241 RepID=UPI002B1F54C6|nr:hypothetical protein [Nostoc sp. UHCC 0252]MEA5603222.1 hypothetical protein [Nostoc sp. UHCC 0252]
MPRKGSEIVQSAETGGEVTQVQSKAISNTRKQQITHQQKASGQALEELEISFDFDLRMAILKRLVQDKHIILEQTDKERQITQALEIAKLEALELARSEGKEQARAIMSQRKREQLAATQQHFIDVELSQLIDSCDYLPYPSSVTFRC